MNKLIILLIAFFFLNNCSFNENSRIWKDKDKELLGEPNIKKVFVKKSLLLENLIKI